LTDYVFEETSGHACPSSGMQDRRDLARLNAAKNGEERSGGASKKCVANIVRSQIGSI
jgi:hypothetical protein